jgi:hypothetical protein
LNPATGGIILTKPSNHRIEAGLIPLKPESYSLIFFINELQNRCLVGLSAIFF